MTPLGKPLAETATALPVFAPPTVTSSFPGVPFCGATTVLEESDTASIPSPPPLLAPLPPPHASTKSETTISTPNIPLQRNPRRFMPSSPNSRIFPRRRFCHKPGPPTVSQLKDRDQLQQPSLAVPCWATGRNAQRPSGRYSADS